MSNWKTYRIGNGLRGHHIFKARSLKEAQENLTDLAEYEEVTETVEEANARRATNYLLAFGVFVAFTVILAVIL